MLRLQYHSKIRIGFVFGINDMNDIRWLRPVDHWHVIVVVIVKYSASALQRSEISILVFFSVVMVALFSHIFLSVCVYKQQKVHSQRLYIIPSISK